MLIVMSKAQNPSTGTDLPYTPSANYAPCRNCEEGTLVWDDEAGESRCRCCGVAA